MDAFEQDLSGIFRPVLSPITPLRTLSDSGSDGQDGDDFEMSAAFLLDSALKAGLNPKPTAVPGSNGTKHPHTNHSSRAQNEARRQPSVEKFVRRDDQAHKLHESGAKPQSSPAPRDGQSEVNGAKPRERSGDTTPSKKRKLQVDDPAPNKHPRVITPQSSPSDGSLVSRTTSETAALLAESKRLKHEAQAARAAHQGPEVFLTLFLRSVVPSIRAFASQEDAKDKAVTGYTQMADLLVWMEGHAAKANLPQMAIVCAYVAGMLSLRCGHLLRSRLRRDCEALTAQATSISSEGGMKDLDLKSLASQTQRVAQGTKQLVLGVELLERAHHSAEALPSLSFQLPPFGFGTSFGENLCLVVEELLNGL